MTKTLTTLALLGAASIALAARVSFTGVHTAHVAEHFPELVPPAAIYRRNSGQTNLVDQTDTMYFVNL
jgi:hypothetical protein